MKKKCFLVLFLLSVVFASSQETVFEENGLRYFINETTNPMTVKVAAPNNEDVEGILIIPESVSHTFDFGTYVFPVVGIAGSGFCDRSLTKVFMPSSIENIGDDAFARCYNLNAVILLDGLQTIGKNAFFETKLTTIEIPSTVTSIGEKAFYHSSSLKNIIINRITPPTLGLNAFGNTTSQRKLTVPCGSLDAYKNNSSWNTAFSAQNSQGIVSDCQTLTSVANGDFNNPATWGVVSMPTAPTHYVISNGNIVNLKSNLVLTSENTLKNNGVLEIHQSGQLINTTETNVGGIVEVKTPTKEANEWTFVGAPFSGYSLQAIVPANNDVSVSMFDYTQGDWSEEWATIETSITSGEGYFLWPFSSGEIIYTTYGDGKYSHNAGSNYNEFSYPQNSSYTYQLTNNDFTITKYVKKYPKGEGYWMALSNPYPAKLSVHDFLYDNSEKGIQGGCTYHFNGSTWEIQNATSGNILMTDGFFVNFSSEGSKTINFKKTQLTDYPSAETKNDKEIEYIELSLIDGNEKVKLYFSHNEKAKKEYDIFDANKMFAGSEIAEPYFVVNGISLVKEEVNTLPYTANINVRSTQSKEMSFIVDNLPEGYTVFLIDRGQDLRLSEGMVYTTQFEAGENVDRFQLLVKKNRQMALEEDLNIKVVNENRFVEVISNENIVNIEVVNALGREVFNTKQKQFTLSEVSSGMYFIRVNISKDSKRIFSKTTKIFIE